MKKVAIIPSRYDSSRFPGKALVDIFGKPMIYWVAKQVSQARLLDEYYVATDSQKIFDACENFRIPVLMTSSKPVNGTERVAETIEKIGADIFINVQGDEPIVSPATIDAVIKSFLADETVEYAQAAKLIEDIKELDDPSVVKIVSDKDGFAIYLSRAKIPYPRKTEGYRGYKHIGVYAFKKAFLKDFVLMGESYLESIEGIEQLRAIENGRRLKIVETDSDTVSIDTPTDLEKLLRSYKHLFKGA